MKTIKRFVLTLLILLMVQISVFSKNNQEFRAVWVITWEYLSPEWSADQIKTKIRQILDNVKKANMNAVLWQVRQSGTAYYSSSYEPWGYYVDHTYPGFDPLEYAVQEAHKRGIELHAWINVFQTYSTYPGTPAAEHPNWICRDGYDQPMPDKYSVSPGLAEVRDYTLNVVMEVVNNYDVDGIHLDYIRWNEYQRSDFNGKPGLQKRSPWQELDGMISEERMRALSTASLKDRYLYDYQHKYSNGIPDSVPGQSFSSWENYWRWSVTTFVKMVHDSIQKVKPWVRLSPAALGKYNWSGWNGYYIVFQDAALWFNEGYIEQLTPMHYHWTTGDEFYGMLKADCPNCWEQWILPGINAKRLYTVGPGSYVLDDYNLWGNHTDIVNKSRKVNWVDGFQFFSYGQWEKHDYFKRATQLFFTNKTKIRPVNPLITPKPDNPAVALSKIDSLHYEVQVAPQPENPDENVWFAVYRSDDDLIDVATDQIVDIHFGKDPFVLQESFTGLQDFNGKYIYYATILNRYWIESDPSNTVVTDSIPSFPPTIIATYPTGDEKIPINGYIYLKFSKTIDTSTVKSALHFNPAVKLKTLTWDDSLKKVTITFAEYLKLNTQYTLKVDSTITDVNGRYLDGNGDGKEGDSFYFVFSTLPEDKIPPQIVGYFPDSTNNRQQFDVRGVIPIWFDEILDENTLSDQSVILKKGDQTVETAFTHVVYQDKSIISIQPNDELIPHSQYKVVLDSSISDTSGNGLEQIFMLDLWTAAYEYSSVQMIDDFSSPASWWQPSGSGSTHGIDGGVTKWGYSTSMYLPATRPHRAAFLRYKWKEDPANPGYLIREYMPYNDPKNKEFDTTYVLQVYIFGDGSYNKFRFCIDERHGSSWSDHEVSKWYTIYWKGWKLVEWKLSDPNSVGSWLRPDNTLNGNKYRIDSFQFTYDEERGAKSGTLYFDDFRLVKKRKVSVNISSKSDVVPGNYTLFQNYPNPFNQTTKIRFYLPKAAKVRLVIYNLAGQQVAVLINEQMQAGYQSINFDASGLASGVYIYALQIGSKQLTKKMTLLK